MEEIFNEFIKVTIDGKGASLTSIWNKKENKELLYQVEEDSWKFQDVVLFPLIGKGEFSYNNTHYSFPLRHGIIRDKEFHIIEKSPIFITLRHESKTEDLAFYPFKFTFDITYLLLKNKILVRTKINNNEKNKFMYFSYGSHTGIKATTNGKIVLSNNKNDSITLYPLNMENGLIDFNNPVNFLVLNNNSNELSLSKDTFKKYDTLVFKNTSSDIILDTGFNYKVKYSFNAPLFAIWSDKNKGDFVCVEPWWGISNYINESEIIEDRLFINKTKDYCEFTYSLEFLF